MPGIFISYRRADSDGWAGRLRDTLRVRFGDLVFQDVDNIPDGEIFSDVIDRALKECDVALIIIGPSWGTARDEQGRRRLDNEDDWVRIETKEVLNHKDKIRVIPVLVGGATLPKAAELPEELRPLTRRQAREIRSNTWDSDVALLSNHLQQIVRRRKRPMWVYAAPVVAVALGVGVFVGTRLLGPTAPSPETPDRTASAPESPLLQREEPAATPKVDQTPKDIARDTPKEKLPELAQPIKVKPEPEALKPAPSAQAASEAQKSKTVEARKSLESRAPAPESAPAASPPVKAPPPTKAAAAPPPPTKPSAAPPPKASVASAPTASADASPSAKSSAATAPARAGASKPEPRTTAAAPADTEAPPERAASAAPAAPKASSSTAARSAVLNLPNRPASSRELRIGDSWTYRLREVSLNRNLAIVTHEIGGGDSGAIREMVRLGEKSAGGAVTERRLALEPRIFEQRVDQNATIFEFAPFMTAFSDLQPGVRWSKIAGAMNSDASMNEWRFSGKVTGREAVRVPAGNFDAIKAELEGLRDSSFPSTRNDYAEAIPAYQTYSIWFVPEIGRAVKYDRRTYNRVRRLLEHEQYELVSYQPK